MFDRRAPDTGDWGRGTNGQVCSPRLVQTAPAVLWSPKVQTVCWIWRRLGGEVRLISRRPMHCRKRGQGGDHCSRAGHISRQTSLSCHFGGPFVTPVCYPSPHVPYGDANLGPKQGRCKREKNPQVKEKKFSEENNFYFWYTNHWVYSPLSSPSRLAAAATVEALSLFHQRWVLCCLHLGTTRQKLFICLRCGEVKGLRGRWWWWGGEWGSGVLRKWFLAQAEAISGWYETVLAGAKRFWQVPNGQNAVEGGQKRFEGLSVTQCGWGAPLPASSGSLVKGVPLSPFPGPPPFRAQMSGIQKGDGRPRSISHWGGDGGMYSSSHSWAWDDR